MSHYFKSSSDFYNEHTLVEKDISDLLARFSLYFKFTSVKHNLTTGSFQPTTFWIFHPSHCILDLSVLPALCGHSRVKENWHILSLLSILTFSTLPIKMTSVRGIDPFGFQNLSLLLTLYQHKLSSPCNALTLQRLLAGPPCRMPGAGKVCRSLMSSGYNHVQIFCLSLSDSNDTGNTTDSWHCR